jgi:hypothetical protein
MVTLTLQEELTIKCRNKNCPTILKQGDECYVYDYEEFCLYKCVEDFLTKKGLSKKQILLLNRRLDIYFTTVEF